MFNSLGIRLNAAQLQEIISDVVGDEPRIDFNAFVILMTRKYKQISFDEEVDTLFSSIDSGNDGIIDSQDVIALLKTRGYNVTVGEAEALLSTLSDTPKGMNKEEFKQFVKTLGAIIMPEPSKD